MRNNVIKAIETNYVVDMIYLAKNGDVSKRRIKVLQIDGDLFRAYCYLRRSNRTFKIDNILAFVPVVSQERVVV